MTSPFIGPVSSQVEGNFRVERGKSSGGPQCPFLGGHLFTMCIAPLADATVTDDVIVWQFSYDSKASSSMRLLNSLGSPHRIIVNALSWFISGISI